MYLRNVRNLPLYPPLLPMQWQVSMYISTEPMLSSNENAMLQSHDCTSGTCSATQFMYVLASLICKYLEYLPNYGQFRPGTPWPDPWSRSQGLCHPCCTLTSPLATNPTPVRPEASSPVQRHGVGALGMYFMYMYVYQQPLTPCVANCVGFFFFCFSCWIGFFLLLFFMLNIVRLSHLEDMIGSPPVEFSRYQPAICMYVTQSRDRRRLRVPSATAELHSLVARRLLA